MGKVKLDEKGREITNPVPKTVTVRSPETMVERVKRMVRQELSEQAHEQEQDSWEEANDFDVEDQWDTYHTEKSKYEVMENEYPLGAPKPPDPVVEETPDPEETPREEIAEEKTSSE